jgi:hypothetical protein
MIDDEDDWIADMARIATALLCLYVLCLANSCTLPDEVEVGIHGNQYEFLGAGDTAWPLQTMDGEGVGVHVSAMWRLRPQQFELIRGVAPWQPEARTVPAVIVNNTEAPPPESAVDTAIKVSSSIDSWRGSTQLLAGVIALALIVVSYWWRGVIFKFLSRKQKP